MKLYGAPVSPYTRKAMLALAYKQLPYELVMTTPGSQDAAFVEASPLGKIPAMRTDTGAAFADSSVIVAYLERCYPAHPLYPADPALLAKALWLEEYADTKLAEALSGLYFQQCLSVKFFGKEANAERIEELQQKLVPSQLALLESLLPAEGWSVGDAISIADIALGADLISLLHTGYDFVDTAGYPRICQLWQRFSEQPWVQQQISTERKMLQL